MSYTRHWEELARRQIAVVVALASSPLVMVVAAFLGNRLLPDPWMSGVLLVVFVAYALVANVAVFRFNRWRCPACGKPFFRRHALLGRSTLRGAACVHCGLARYAPARGRRAPGGGTLRGFLAYRRRVREGRCGYCGYDLRGGHEHCPECGEAAGAFAPIQSYARVMSLSLDWPHDRPLDVRLVRVLSDGRAVVRHGGTCHTIGVGDTFRHAAGGEAVVSAVNVATGTVILTVKTRASVAGRVSA